MNKSVATILIIAGAIFMAVFITVLLLKPDAAVVAISATIAGIVMLITGTVGVLRGRRVSK